MTQESGPGVALCGNFKRLAIFYLNVVKIWDPLEDNLNLILKQVPR